MEVKKVERPNATFLNIQTRIPVVVSIEEASNSAPVGSSKRNAIYSDPLPSPSTSSPSIGIFTPESVALIQAPVYRKFDGLTRRQPTGLDWTQPQSFSLV